MSFASFCLSVHVRPLGNKIGEGGYKRAELGDQLSRPWSLWLGIGVRGKEAEGSKGGGGVEAGRADSRENNLKPL